MEIETKDILESRILISNLYQKEISDSRILINDIVSESRMLANSIYKRSCKNKL